MRKFGCLRQFGAGGPQCIARTATVTAGSVRASACACCCSGPRASRYARARTGRTTHTGASSHANSSAGRRPAPDARRARPNCRTSSAS